MSLINLSDVAQNSTVTTVFDVAREAAFDNTVDFYQVSSPDGSVVDPETGETIAPGESGYAQAALANRVGLSLATDNGGSSQFTTELAGGAIYAPVIVVNSNFDPLVDGNPNNDPNVYFTFAEANIDGFDHVQNSSENVFGFEDLLGGGDEDFDDVTVTVSTGETIIEPPVEETPETPEETPDEPIDETPEETPEETPVDESVDESVDETPETPVDETPEVPEETPDEPVDPDADQELALQIFYPDGETPLYEFSRETGESTEQREISFVSGVFRPSTGGPGRENNPLTPASEQFYEDNPTPDNPFDNGYFIDAVNSDTLAFYNPERNVGDIADRTIGPYNVDSYTYEITDVSGTIPAFESVTIDPLSTLPINESDITFTEDSISVNFAGVAGIPQSYLLLNVEFAGDGGFVPGDGTEDRAMTNGEFVDDLLEIG